MTFLEALRIFCKLAPATPAEKAEAAQMVRAQALRTARGFCGGGVVEPDDLAQQACLALFRNGRPTATTDPEARAYVSKTVQRIGWGSVTSAAQQRKVFERAEEGERETAHERAPAPPTAEPDRVIEAREQEHLYREAVTWVREVLSPAVAITLNTESARVTFLRTVEAMWQLRADALTMDQLVQEEMTRPGRTLGPRTAKQASDAVDRRFAVARLRLLTVMQAIEQLSGLPTPPVRAVESLPEASVVLARMLLAAHPYWRGGRVASLRYAVERLCYDRVAMVWRSILDG